MSEKMAKPSREMQLMYTNFNGASSSSVAASCDAVFATSSDVGTSLGQSLSGNTSTGAMTYSFIKAVQNEPQLTYGRLLSAIRSTVRESRTGGFLNGPISSMLKNVLYPEQVPQLSSSEIFDIYSTPFIM